MIQITYYHTYDELENVWTQQGLCIGQLNTNTVSMIVKSSTGVYAWDGSLLSNTLLREVIEAFPVNDKRFLVENYPKKYDSPPDHLLEVQHRARDIMFSDKTLHSIQMSKTITYYLRFIGELYHMIERELDAEKKEKNKEKLKKIRIKYKKNIRTTRCRN